MEINGRTKDQLQLLATFIFWLILILGMTAGIAIGMLLQQWISGV